MIGEQAALQLRASASGKSDGSEVREVHLRIRGRECPTVSVVLREQVTAVFVEVERLWAIDEDLFYLLTADQYFLLAEIHRCLPDS